MALERQLVPIPLAGGIDNKTDDKQVPIGKLSVLENGVFSSPKKIIKRSGYAEIGAGGTVVPYMPTDGRDLSNFKNELLINTNTDLYSFSFAEDTLTNKGSIVPVTTKIDSVVNTKLQKDHCLYCTNYAETYEVYVYRDESVSPNVYRYTTVDIETNNITINNALISSSYISGFTPVQLVAFGSQVLLICASNSGYTTRIITLLLPSVGFYGYSDIASHKALNACTSSTRLYIVFQYSTGYRIRSYDVSLSQQATVDMSEGGTPVEVLYSTSLSRLFVAYRILSGSDYICKFQAYSSTLGLVQAAKEVRHASTGINIDVFTMNLLANGNLYFFVQETAATPNHADSNLRRIIFTYSGGYNLSSDSLLYYNICLCSTAAINTVTDKIYILVGQCLEATMTSANTDKMLQSTYYLMDQDGDFVAQSLKGLAGCFQECWGDGYFNRPLKKLIKSSSTAFFRVAAYRMTDYFWPPIDTLGISPYFKLDIVKITFNFDTKNNALLCANTNNLSVISNCITSMYDSANVCELGFLRSPQKITVVANEVDTKTYSYIATYEWLDLQGQRHISAISEIATMTGNAAEDATVTVPSLAQTQKENIEIAIYRTTNGGSTFYRCRKSTDDKVYNDKTVATVTVRRDIDDTILAEQEQLYTNGDVLENSPPPTSEVLVSHKNRIFIVDSENPNNLYYSKKMSSSLIPPEFSSELYLTVDPTGGPITALGSMDDKLIIFKKDRYFILIGQGPDDTGAQNDFSEAQSIISDVGCISPKSILLIPDGLMFYSNKGMYLLDRSLQTQFIGYDIAAFSPSSASLSDFNIISSATIAELHQARFIAYSQQYSKTEYWVYDYLLKQWSKFTGITPRALCNWSVSGNQNYTVLIHDNKLSREIPAIYADMDSNETMTYVSLKITTGWINLAAIGGFQRVRRLIITGTDVDNAILSIVVTYDYDDSAPHYYNLTCSGSGEDFLRRIHLDKQKCTAIKISIYDEEGLEYATGGGYQLSTLTLEVGVKKGTNKISAANTATSWSP